MTSPHGRRTVRLRGGGAPETVGEWGERPRTTPTQQGNVRARGGTTPSIEEGADLQGFTPTRVHLSFQEVYGYLPHHNDGTHLVGGVLDDATWKSC